MPDMYKNLREFHEKFGLEYNGKPRLLPEELAKFRILFMREELKEYTEIPDPYSITQQLEDQLDALVDLVYVALGTAYLHGFDFNEAWNRVHAANMEKVRALRAEDSKRGFIFDVVKPPGWMPPTHIDLVMDHAHRKSCSICSRPLVGGECPDCMVTKTGEG